METNRKKIVLIGAGSVGVSFLYSAMNRGTAQEYGIIDLNETLVDGHVLDFEDAASVSHKYFKVKKSTYADLKDTDIIVITAGRPQKPGETRLEMVADNAKIMAKIAESVKKSGFKGITLVIANPVDIMTYVYQKVTGFDYSKVISSGTALDSSRLKFALSRKFDINPASVTAYVLGEHGDSSVSAYSAANISGKQFMKYVDEGKISKQELVDIHNEVFKKAYEIINRKGATYYGIGAVAAEIVEAILTDSHKVIVVGAHLTGQYGIDDIYTGTPCVINGQGIKKIVELELSKDELDKLQKSAVIIKENIQKAFNAIK